jgi:hypothetical protein
VSFSTLADGAGPSGSKFATTADPRQALAQLAAQRAKLEALPADERAAREERARWAKAGARMGGAKIRDDEGRLKKAAKRKDKEKEKGKKAWYASLFASAHTMLTHAQGRA